MRKLLLLLIVLSSIAASSQQWSLPVSNHQRIAGLWAERRLKLPADTAFTKEAGCVTLINGVLYVADGTKWNTYASGGGSSAGVSSFDGRFGAVVPQTGDYTINMITGGLDSIRRRVDSIWVSGGSIFVRKGSNQNSFPISVDWASGYPTYDGRYPSITRFLDTSANIWSRVQSTYQVAQANYSTTYSLSNDIRDSLSARYTKAQSDARFLQSFTESDPVWTAAAANYYTKTQADARYLQSFTETDPTVYAWAKAATKPAYAVAEITGLQTALDGKEPVLGFTPVPNTRTINGYALSANISLTKTDVGLGNVPNTDATNPANISQSASYRFVTDTEKSTWNGKQNALGYTPENAANKGQANGYADLDANGKVPASRIDFSQTGQTFVVASQSAMLAVSGANVGAMAIRTDQSRTYVLIATPASTLANWVQLLSPDAPVQSVNGQTGNVNLLTTNIGEGTNLYYTDARARASLSFAAGSGGYNSSTGVITIPTNTSQLTNGANFITATTNALTNYYTITQSDARFAQLTGAEFTGNLTLPNGVFYRARRSTSNAVINVLGFDSGTDNLSMMISNDLLIRNTGAVTVMSLTNGGNLSTLGTITGTAINGTTGTFSNVVTVSGASNYLSLNNIGYVRADATGNTLDLQAGSGGLRVMNAGYGAALLSMTNAGVTTLNGSLHINTGASTLRIGSGLAATSTNSAQAWFGSQNWRWMGSAWTREPSTNAVMWGSDESGGFGVWTVSTGDATTTGVSGSNLRFGISNSGAASFSTSASFNSSNILLGSDGTYGGTYNALGFGGLSNGSNRIFAAANGADGIYIAAATGRAIYFRAGGGTTDHLSIQSNGVATFSSSVAATQLNLSGNINLDKASGDAAILTNNPNGSTTYWRLSDNSTIRGYFGLNGLTGGSNADIAIYSNTGGIRLFANSALALNIASTGAATFTSSVQATQGTFSNSATSTNLVVQRTGSNNVFMQLSDASGSHVFLGNAGGDFVVQTAGGGYTNKLTISSAGAATFSSTIAAGGHITLPNGAFFRATRNTSSAVLNVLGFESGTDNLAMTISDNLLIKNTGASTIYTLTWQGAATYAGGITAPTGNFTSTTASTSGTTGAVVIAGGLGVGGAIHASGGFFNSDKRWKNIEQRISASSGIDAVKWTWNASHQVDYREHWGYVAQEVLKVLPEAVSMSAEGFYSVEYNSVFTYKIAMLEKRVADLEKKATLTDWLTEKVLQLQLQVINLQFPQKSNRK